MVAGLTGKELATEQCRKDWHVYVDLTECRPSYIHAVQLFGKATGPHIQDASLWGQDEMNALKHLLTTQNEKPMFFCSGGQSWSCWHQMSTVWLCSAMFSKRQVPVYNTFLLRLQEEFRLEGRPNMFL